MRPQISGGDDSSTEGTATGTLAVKTVRLPDKFEERLQQIMASYPDPGSAVMPALYMAQEHFGYISEDAIQWVAARLEWAPIKVMEIATFYTMYYKQPVGEYHVQVCRTLPCALRGAAKLTAYLKKRFETKQHEVTPDGKWSYEEVECLGSCGSAPMCQINDRFFENLGENELRVLLDALASEGGDLRLSSYTDKLGTGLERYSVSQIEGKD
jgi:NADH-quinone oxidoreductase E subunit